MLALATALCGCSASHVIDLYAADYRDTAATAGDAQLLLNILRAKDDLPIHFSDLSVIHGSIQLTAGTGTTTLPFAHLTGSTTPSSVNPALSATSSPTFDLGTLDTQDFTRGVLSPVDLNVIKQLFDQGIDARLLLMLFFSEYDAKKERYLNNTQCNVYKPPSPYELGCHVRMYDYLEQVNTIIGGKGIYPADARQELQANIFRVLKPIGGPLYGSLTFKENLADLRQLDPKKYALKGNQLFSISDPQLAICHYGKDSKLHALFITAPSAIADDICNKSEVPYSSALEKVNAGLSVRSTYEIIQYLGQVLRFQEEREPNRCLTLDPDRNKNSATRAKCFSK